MPTVSVESNSQESPKKEAKSFEIEENSLLFDGLESQGEILPHGCLAGSCGSCKIFILEGTDNLSPPGAVERDTIEYVANTYKEEHGEKALLGKSIRLSCRARVIGNIRISPIK